MLLVFQNASEGPVVKEATAALSMALVQTPGTVTRLRHSAQSLAQVLALSGGTPNRLRYSTWTAPLALVASGSGLRLRTSSASHSLALTLNATGTLIAAPQTAVSTPRIQPATTSARRHPSRRRGGFGARRARR